MMLVEQTTVPSGALPVADFKDHLRLGTGFADDGVQDNVLESYLRASMAAIEARTGKVLITRTFSWTLTGWRELCRQALPVAQSFQFWKSRLLTARAVKRSLIRIDTGWNRTLSARGLFLACICR